MDFRIANAFGKGAVRDTYKRAFEEWKHNVNYMAELTYVLNAWCWALYERGNMELSKLYSDLYYKNHHWCLDNFKGDDAETYFRLTD